jgi:ABC-type glycerol-3-phosphate transport system permease component
LPYLWMIGSSLRPGDEIFHYVYPLSFHTIVPLHWTPDAYKTIFLQLHFGNYLFNSFTVAMTQVVLGLFVNSLAGYFFARLAFPGRNILFILVLATMMIPLEALVVPMYLVVRALHLLNTWQVLFLPWIAQPFGIFLFRQFFSEIPYELDEAAIVDGASTFRVYWNVLLPNTVPAMITFALISFLFAWNSFLWPLIVIQDISKQLVQVFIATFQGNIGTEISWSLIFASATVATLPILTLFAILQRYYLQGMVSSGIKG